MEITDDHWDCFRLAIQEKRPIHEVAQTLGKPDKHIRYLLAELRKAEPELFPYEREYLQAGQHHVVVEPLGDKDVPF